MRRWRGGGGGGGRYRVVRKEGGWGREKRRAQVKGREWDMDRTEREMRHVQALTHLRVRVQLV